MITSVLNIRYCGCIGGKIPYQTSIVGRYWGCLKNNLLSLMKTKRGNIRIYHVELHKTSFRMFDY